MLNAELVPDGLLFLWLFFFAGAVVGTAALLRLLQPRGFAWWSRYPILIGFLVAGHALQAVTPLRGLPGLVQLLMFPLVPSALGDEYGSAFYYAGMPMREAYRQGEMWGLWHGGMIWFIVASLIFANCWLRRGRVVYGN